MLSITHKIILIQTLDKLTRNTNKNFITVSDHIEIVN